MPKKPVTDMRLILTIVALVAAGVAFPFTTFETKAHAEETREMVKEVVQEMKVLTTELSGLVGYLKGVKETQVPEHSKPSTDSEKK